MWRETLRKISAREVNLTEDMITKGMSGSRSTEDHPSEFVRPGDLLTPSQDMNIKRDNKSVTIFSEGQQYKVITFRTHEESSYPWVILQGNNNVIWGISFDDNLGGGAKFFKKVIQDSEEKDPYDDFMKNSKNILYVNSILKALWQNRGKQNRLKLVPLHRDTLEGSVRKLMFASSAEVPTQQEFTKVKAQISYYTAVLEKMNLISEVENFFVLTEQGINYCSDNF